jgi:hypothetical protein
MDDIPTNVLDDCGALVKANSIQGCKVGFMDKWRDINNDAASARVGGVFEHSQPWIVDGIVFN